MALKFPADFDKCVRDGGRVKTIQPKPGKYLHVCWDAVGKSHSGEVQTKKKASEIDSYLLNLGYIKTKDGFEMSEETALKTLVPQIKLGKAFAKKTTDIEILHAGEWEHPQYGAVKISEDDIDKFITSFKTNVRKVELAVDQEHLPEKGAAGWYKNLKKVFEDGKAKLKATIDWTPVGQQLIKDGIFKYFSPEFDFDYEDLETHEHFENVLLGGALTNRPYFKSLAPVALSENMYAGFTSKSDKKGGERTVTKKELKAKLAEDPKFELPKDASDEDTKLFEEVKDEVAKEAEDKEEKEKKEAEEKVKTEEEEKKKAEEEEEKKKAGEVKGSEKFILKAQHTKELNEMKSELGVVKTKLRFKEVKEEVQGYVFSTSNPDGVLLPKNKDTAVKILMAVNTKTAKLFKEFLDELPAVSRKLFVEEGSGDDTDDSPAAVRKEAQKLVEDGKAKTYGEAIKIIAREKPDLLKTKGK